MKAGRNGAPLLLPLALTATHRAKLRDTCAARDCCARKQVLLAVHDEGNCGRQ
jgi:hypothetical protein